MNFFASLGRPDVLDLARQTHYFWALFPEIVLALGAMLVLIVDVVQKGTRSEDSRPLIPVLSLVVLAVTALANTALFGLTDGSRVGMVAVDGFRVFTNFVYLLSAAFAIAISVGYLNRRGIMRGEFHALVLFATLGMMLMGGARDLIMTFIGLEVMSVSVYVLVGFDRMDPRSSEASLKYFLLGAFSSGFFLYGIALTFGATGSTNLTSIANSVGLSANSHPVLLMAGIALMLVGFGFKTAAMPFHMWTPDAYDGAPTPVTALMATGVKAAAFAAFIRVFVVAFAGASDQWVPVMWWIAAVTMVAANLIAVTQGSVKRMLAYSSIAHAGYLLVAVLSANDTGKSAFLFYALVYTVMTAGAFGIVAANSRDGQERVTLEDYAGFGWDQPWLGALFAVFLLSLAGFPLTAGFLGKLYILRAAVEAGQTPLAIVLVMSSLVSYFYYLRVIVVMYMRPSRSEGYSRGLDVPGALHGAVTLAALAVILLFLAGTFPLRWAERSAATLWTQPQGGPAGAPMAGPLPLR
jgi:NADH-quinone oxidoreductase subunit N